MAGAKQEWVEWKEILVWKHFRKRTNDANDARRNKMAKMQDIKDLTY